MCVFLIIFPVDLHPFSDFARLLQEAKTLDDKNTFAIKILREVNFSLSIALNYFFFLIFLGRPPRGEVKLVNVADRARARRDSPSRWAYWGLPGYVLQALLGATVVSVAILEMIWRVSGNAGGTIYMANGIVQGVLSVAFLGKTFLNTYLSPLSPRWKTARDYLPVIFALSTRLAIVLASEFCSKFLSSCRRTRSEQLLSRPHRVTIGPPSPGHSIVRSHRLFACFPVLWRPSGRCGEAIVKTCVFLPRPPV